MVALPPVTPFTCQFALGTGMAPTVVTVNCCVAPASTVTELGDTLKAEGMVTVTEADAEAVVSACETAVTMVVAGFGTVDGAVYTPVDEMVPTAALPPAVPFTCQVTAVFVVLATDAMNCSELPAGTFAEAGEIVTLTSEDELPLPPLLWLFPQPRRKKDNPNARPVMIATVVRFMPYLSSAL